MRGIGVKQRSAYAVIKTDLEEQLRNMRDEKEFLTAGHAKAKDCYESKRKLLNISEDSLFALAWDVEGYSKLIEKNTTITEGINDIVSRINGPVHGRGNIQADVSAVKKELEPYIKGVTTKKREAAPHLLLFMISDELRNFKPYAVPVRVIKYKSITDAMLREFKEELRKAMKECGMTTVGMYKIDYFNELHFPVVYSSFCFYIKLCCVYKWNPRENPLCTCPKKVFHRKHTPKSLLDNKLVITTG